MKSKNVFIILLLLGLVLRLSLLFADFSFDVNNHITWAKDLHNFGFSGFYEKPSSEVYATRFPNYPPLALFIFYLLYPIQSILFKINWWLNVALPIYPSKLIFFIQTREFMAGMFKLAGIAADLGIAIISYRLTKKLLVASLVLFNPAFFYNSSYWGQIDAVPLFFALLSFYFLLFLRRPIVSAVFLTLGLLVKPTLLVFLPIYAVAFLKKYNYKKFLLSAMVSALVFWFAFLPFFRQGNIITYPLTTYLDKILATQSLPYVTNGAFNFWVLITQYQGIKDITPLMLGISYRFWGYMIVGLFFVFLISKFLKSKNKAWDFYYFASLCALTAFIFLTKMHERYSLLPLLFLLIASFKKPWLLPWFLLLSFVSFLNLYHSWPVPAIEILKAVMANIPVNIFLSSLNIFVLIYLLIRIMFPGHEKQRV